MAETDKPDGAKPIVDVAHPGKSAPSGNSKSVIVSNRPLLKDPMMVDGTKTPDDNPSNSPPAKIKGPDKPKLQSLTAPLLEIETPDETSEPVESVPPAEPEPEPEPKSKPEPEPKPEEADKPSLATTPADEPATTGDTSTPADKDNENGQSGTDKPDTGQAAADRPDVPEDDGSDKPETTDADAEGQTPAKGSAQQLEAEAAAEAKHQAAITKLADSKQYYLPINTVEKRRSRRFVAIGVILSLLLIVAWVDIALDAGLIQIHGLKPITHFFSS